MQEHHGGYSTWRMDITDEIVNDFRDMETKRQELNFQNSYQTTYDNNFSFIVASIYPAFCLIEFGYKTIITFIDCVA